ncbi:MAG: arsenate reductase ArsC [Mucispirillum sp.]|nr:arsenate reductase ArsC [Mucispirillum sp.]
MKNIVFICIHNSCRSQIAEYFGKKYLGDIYNVYSAGSEIKSEINKDAVRIIKQLYNDDISLSQHPKTINEIPEPDIIISMGCYNGCPYLNKDFTADWQIEDPTGKNDFEFIKIINQIKEKVLQLKNIQYL